jgi:hypothetical protein
MMFTSYVVRPKSRPKAAPRSPHHESTLQSRVFSEICSRNKDVWMWSLIREAGRLTDLSQLQAQISSDEAIMSQPRPIRPVRPKAFNSFQNQIKHRNRRTKHDPSISMTRFCGHNQAEPQPKFCFTNYFRTVCLSRCPLLPARHIPPPPSSAFDLPSRLRGSLSSMPPLPGSLFFFPSEDLPDRRRASEPSLDY